MDFLSAGAISRRAPSNWSLLCILSSFGDEEAIGRTRLPASVSSISFWRAEKDQEWAIGGSSKPRYLLFPDEELDHLIKDVNRRLGHALKGAHLGMPMLMAARTFPSGTGLTGKPSIAAMIRTIYPGADSVKLKNVRKEYWQPYRRVVHILCAIDIAIRELNEHVKKHKPADANQYLFSFFDFLGDAKLTRDVATLSERLAPLFPKTGHWAKFHRDRVRLILT